MTGNYTMTFYIWTFWLTLLYLKYVRFGPVTFRFWTQWKIYLFYDVFFLWTTFKFKIVEIIQFLQKYTTTKKCRYKWYLIETFFEFFFSFQSITKNCNLKRPKQFRCVHFCFFVIPNFSKIFSNFWKCWHIVTISKIQM